MKKNSKSSKSNVSKKTNKISKAAFVRQHAGKTAKEVVELAKKQGIKMGEPYVYNVRAYDKGKGVKKDGKSHKRGQLAPQAAVDILDHLRAIASEIGLSHAIEELTAMREEIQKKIRG